MAMPLFTAPDAWHGGFYELALEMGARSDERLMEGLAALWTFFGIEGCYRDYGREPADQQRLRPDDVELGAHLLGTAELPNGRKVVCGSCVVRESSGTDWLDFYLPLGSLSEVYPTRCFPFGAEEDWPGPWRFEIENWLAVVGQSLAERVPYRLGLIGFEVCGEASSADIAANGVPGERRMGYLVPKGDAVEYHRRNQL